MPDQSKGVRVNSLRRIKGGGAVAVLSLTAVMAFGGLVAAAPANAAGPLGSNAAMVVDSTGSISGIVTGTGSVPLNEVGILASGSTSVDVAWTDSAGNYTLTGLNPGTYNLMFIDVSETRAKSYLPGEAQMTVVASTEAVLNITLTQASVFAGKVTKNVGGVVTPAVDVDVTVYSLDGEEVDYSWTDDDGKYDFALPAGKYKVSFGEVGATSGLEAEYYNDVYSFGAAKTLVLGTAAAVTGINAQLSSVRHVNAVTPTITGKKQVGYTPHGRSRHVGPGNGDVQVPVAACGRRDLRRDSEDIQAHRSDAGKAISVKVRGYKTGYTALTRASVATAAIARGLTAPKPTITGTKKVGYTLTAKPGTWGPGTVTLKYQWYRSGVAIYRGTGKTYKLVSADRHDTIKVRVLGSKAGYKSVAKYSLSTVNIP